MTDRLKTVRDSYSAYETRDRDAIERLLADDLVFSAPPDVGIDRATYFERCWPERAGDAGVRDVRLTEVGDEVLVALRGHPSATVPRRPSRTIPLESCFRASDAKCSSRACLGSRRMNTPPIVSPAEWEAARLRLRAKEKELTSARDALAAERRRMPWLAVEKDYRFDGPDGPASLLDLFDGRRQLLLYRAFYEPGVAGWPEHGCVGCSFMADHVPNLAHLNARDTTLVYASRAPQDDIRRLQARMGWEHIPWYTMTDGFDADFGVDEWHGTNAFIREGERIFRTYFINAPRRRMGGDHVDLPRPHGARAPGGVGGLPGRLPADAAVRVVEVARRLRRRASEEHLEQTARAIALGAPA